MSVEVFGQPYDAGGVVVCLEVASPVAYPLALDGAALCGRGALLVLPGVAIRAETPLGGVRPGVGVRVFDWAEYLTVAEDLYRRIRA